MDKNRIIILALVVLIIALLVGIFAVMPNMESKQDTNLTFKCNSTVSEGDFINIELTDANGTAIANQTVNVTIEDKDKFSDYHSVVTNDKGVGKVKMDKDPGEYEITITYGGNDKYNGCNATKKITIDEEVVEATTSQSDNSDSSSQDSEREEYKTTSDGWNPGDHEGSRESIGDGNERVRYDDGYFRIVDQEGDIVTYGWA